MAYEVDKELPCEDCGELTYRRLNVKRTPLCVICAIKRSTANVISLHSHSGPQYDHWRESMRRFASRL